MILPSFRSRIWATVFFVFAVAGVGSYLFRQQHGIALVEEWSQEITIASQEASLPNPFLLAGLVFAESRGKANAISKAGALGLCQLMPTTAQELADRYDVSGPPYQPLDNLRMGAHYLKELHKQFKNDWDLALLGYRLGPGRVRRELASAGGKIAWVKTMQANPPSPWSYRDQIAEYQQVFQSRSQKKESVWKHAHP